LFTNVAQSMQLDNTFIELMGEVLLINRLSREIDNLKQGKHSYNYVNKLLFNKDGDTLQLILKMEKTIDQHIEKVQDLLLQLPNSFRLLKDNLQKQYNVTYNTTLAEEG